MGAKVKSIKPGMRVMALTHTGGYEEYAKASMKDIICLPDRISYLQGLVYHINLRLEAGL